MTSNKGPRRIRKVSYLNTKNNLLYYNKVINYQNKTLSNYFITLKLILFIITDDAFFNRNWAGACGGRWVGPKLLMG